MIFPKKWAENRPKVCKGKTQANLMIPFLQQLVGRAIVVIEKGQAQ